MNTKSLTRIWTAVGTVNLFYVLNAYIVSQGGNAVFGVNLVDLRPVTGSYTAGLICGLITLIVHLIGREYIRKTGQAPWAEKIPLVVLDRDGLDLQSTGLKAYQGFFLFAFAVLPALSLLHFNDKVISHADIADKLSRKIITENILYSPGKDILLSSENFGNNFCMGQDLPSFDEVESPCAKIKDKPQSGGITWFPVFSAMLLILVTVLVFLSTIDFLFMIFLRRRLWWQRLKRNSI